MGENPPTGTILNPTTTFNLIRADCCSQNLIV